MTRPRLQCANLRVALPWALALCASACGYTADYEIAERAGATGSGSTDSTIRSDSSATDAGPRAACPPVARPEAFEECPAVCTGGCDRVTGTCMIECDEAGECRESEIRCPSGFVCDIRCTGESSCEKSKLICPEEQACGVRCLGKVSCREAHVNCHDGACDIVCDEDGCHDAVISCGLGPCRTTCPGEPPKSQSCGEACECVSCP